RPPRDYGVEIHLLEALALILDAPARHDLKTLQQRFCLFASVGLRDADDDVVAVLVSGPGLLQHFVGFADTRRGAHEDLQLAETSLFTAGGLKQGIRRGALVRLTPLVGHGASVLAREVVLLAHHGVPARSKARFSASTFTPGSPKTPRVRPSICSATSWRSAFSGMFRAFAMRGTWK